MTDKEADPLERSNSEEKNVAEKIEKIKALMKLKGALFNVMDKLENNPNLVDNIIKVIENDEIRKIVSEKI